MEGAHIRPKLPGDIITLYTKVRVGRMLLRAGMRLNRPPFKFNFRVLPDKFKEIPVTPLTIGTFIIIKNPHQNHHKTSRGIPPINTEHIRLADVWLLPKVEV
jgi:hypothetical protein